MANFIVTTLEDEVEDNGTLSLREAIALANASGGADTITFDAGLEGTIRLTEGELDSFGDLTVNGDGRITISGDALGNDGTSDGITDVAATLAADGDLMGDNVKIFDHRFELDGEVVTLVLDGLTLTGGYSTFLGGAVDTDDYVNLRVIDSTISGNYAANDGGGAYVGGEITVINSTFEGNLSGDEGGAISVQYGAEITDSRIINNRSSDDGGGISVLDGGATISGGEVSGNRTDNFKGSQFNTNKGGGIYADGDISIINAVIANNTAEGNGGGVYAVNDIAVTDATIEGNQARNGGGLFGDEVTITGATIARNTAARPEGATSGGTGGGVYARDEFVATDSVIRDNTALSSGGAESAGSVDIERSTFSGNAAQFNGALFTDSGGEIEGSVFVDNDGGAGVGAVVNSGTLTVTGSAFTGNTGDDAGAIYDQGDGLTVSNSTFVGNSSDDNAGAIRSRNAPELDHVTVTGNTSGETAGAVNVVGGTITNSIITSNLGGGEAGPDLTNDGGYVPYSGTITFTGVSIIGEDDAAFGSDGAPYSVINGAAEDIFVNVVEDNGGPAPTLALLAVAENPALDATNLISQNEDARGGPRPRDIEGVDNGGAVDLGAFELNVANLNGEGLQIDGQFGAELLLGTDDDDTITGGGSFEDSVAGSGADTILGFGGDDLLDGEGGADSIEGGVGDDTIIGGPSDSEDRIDTIFGGDGNDDINGGFSVDQIFGGAGDDSIRVVGIDEIDDVDGGEGDDTLDLSATDPTASHTVDLGDEVFVQNRFEGDFFQNTRTSIINVENVIGGDGRNGLFGDERANLFEGGLSDDQLLGDGGADTLRGGDGDDRLQGDEGDDLLQGDDGDDTLLGGAGDDLLEGGDGADNLRGDAGDDTLIGGGASDGDGVDTLDGGDGDDVFDGGFFVDQIFGGAGDDTVLINGIDFADDIDGGEDIDTVDFSGADADIFFEVNLAAGTIVREQSGRVPNDSGSLVNVENLIGGSGGDILVGNDQSNRLEGGLGADTLTGGAGTNLLDGGEGEDEARFDGAFADYVITVEPDEPGETGASLKLTRILPEGEDLAAEETVIKNIETLVFSDQSISFQDLLGPVANADAFATDEDTALIVDAVAGVLANDTDLDGDDLTAELVTDVAFGTLDLNEDGSFTYTPDANAFGEDSFTYLVRDETGATDEAEVTITVNPVNDAPVITSNSAFTVAENDTAIGVVLAEDVDGDDLTFAITGGVDADLFTINAISGVLSFRTAPDFEQPGDAGRDNIHDVEITATDAGGLADIQALTVEVTDADEAPVITSNAVFAADENQTIAGAITASDDKAGASFSITGGVDAILFSINAATGALRFRAAPNFEAPTDANGDNTYEVEITVTDSDGLTASQAVSVVVGDVNDAPEAEDITVAGDEDTVIRGALVASDEDGDALVFALADGPDNGDVTVNGDGTFAFTPDADFNGTDSFTLRASDGDASDTAEATITVRPVDEPDDPADPGDGGDPVDDGDNGDNGGLGGGGDQGDPDDGADDGDDGAGGDDGNDGAGGDDGIDGAGGDDGNDGAGDDDGNDGAGGGLGEGGDQDDPGDDGDAGDDGDDGDPVEEGGEDDGEAEPPIGAEPPGDPVDPPAVDGPTPGDDLLIGTAQNDTINALAGDDTVKGLRGDDFLIGSDGDDQIRGGGGADSLRGGAGADRLLGNGGDDDVRGSGGADAIIGGGGSDKLRGGGGADMIRGGGGSDLIIGNGGADMISAGGGADTVRAGGGADAILGGGGADLLEGGGGRDTISGQLGDDTLRGGGGADVFQFNASDRNDTILDFRQGQDMIEILSGGSSFGDLSIQQDGRDVLIGFGVAGQIRIITDDASAFDADDFLF